MADPTPSSLAKDLREGRISYQQYQDGIAALNAVPPDAAASAPETDPKKVLAEQMSQRANVSTGNAALAGQPPTTAPPATLPLNAGQFTISAPPPPGAASMQGAPGPLPPAASPGDAVLSQMIQARGAPSRALGMSPADKAHVAELQQRGAGYGQISGEAEQQIGAAQDQLAQQNWILDQQTRLAADMHAAGMQRDAERRRMIEAEHKDRSSKIAAELSDLQARGINPNQYWQSRGTAGQFAGAIAVAFSTAGSQIGRGGTNAALEIFGHAVDQEIDAQKTNLQKSLNVAKAHMEQAGTDWDHDVAMLKAERDSTETAYQVAMNQVQSYATRYKDNAQFQANAANLIAGLKLQDQDKIGTINDQIYAAMKRAETPVGGADNKIAQQVIARTIQIRDKAHEGGREITPEQARSEAVREIVGVNMNPGGGEPQLGKVERGGEGAKTTVLVNGQPMQAINEEQAKSFSKFNEAYPEEKRLHQVLTDAWAKQDWGRYQQARQAFIELAPRVYGFTRGPSGAQAGEGGGDDAAIRGTVAGQIPEMNPTIPNNWHYWGGRGATMLSQVGEHLNSIYDNMWRSTFTAPSPGNPLGLQRR